MRLVSCDTVTSADGTTVGVPPDSGSGWLTVGFSEIVTVRLPCATAAAVTRTYSPITTVPVRELMMTLAPVVPGSSVRFSSTDTNDTRWPRSRGACTAIDVGGNGAPRSGEG